MACTPARVPVGHETGGQFATEPRPEPDISLDAYADDDYGFPTVVCTRCHGTGRSAWSPEARHDRCFTCQGTGRCYPPGVVAAAVRQFAAARMDASRPRVRQLRVGDLVTTVEDRGADRGWRRVSGVLVYPNRPTPTRPEATGTPAYVARVEFTDGSALMATTDTVLARRGADVDPTPYVQALRERLSAARA
jgi:hypothetical protein